MDNYLNKVVGGRYEIQEIIGIGGMSVVYKAYDRLDDRIVAVKILKDEYMANEEFRMRFKNESKAISVLSHPNIVKVYDVNFGDDLQYIVMEYVEGITLKEYIERQRVLDVREAEHFAIQILRALQHAHDKGIVHRDIKPQNIMLLPNANIKVTDFGIARFNRVESRNVNETSAIGSVHYVSPEQAKGEYTDGRSDIYSVGVVLYEMITGKVPFEADNDTSVALMQLQEEAVRPSVLNPSIPVGLEQITMRAMQKDPANRYQSAAEFLSDLYELKRNPKMKFDHTFFVDSNPTKYIQTAAPLTTADIPVRGAKDAGLRNGNDEEDDDEEEEETERNVTVPVLIGIALSLVLIVGAILAVAFGDTIKEYITGSNTSTESFWEKLDIFNLFSSDKVEVPNFINMTFEDALKKYPDYAIDKTPNYIFTNNKDDAGKVIGQSPEAGAKVSKDTVIKLSVATNSEMVQIPNVINTHYSEAQTILESKGFKVELLQATGESAKENTVIFTNPNVATYARYGSTVYVYYVSATAERETTTRVPNLSGDSVDVARQKILAAGLKFGGVQYDASSEALRGFVIGQNPESGTSVNAGAYVYITVGNGIQDTATATVRITLPTTSAGRKATITTYLNDAAYDSVADVTLDGSELALSFTGSGPDNTFAIYADNVQIYSGKIDFTRERGMVYEAYSYPFVVLERIPNVVNMTEAQAVAEFQKLGFTNIKVEKVYHSSVAPGLVERQTPVASDLAQYYTTALITLYVSTEGEPPTEAPPTELTEPPTEPPTEEPPTEEPPTEEPPTEEPAGEAGGD